MLTNKSAAAAAAKKRGVGSKGRGQPTDMSRDAGYQSVTGTAKPEAAARDDVDNDVRDADADDEQNDNDKGNSRT